MEIKWLLVYISHSKKCCFRAFFFVCSLNGFHSFGAEPPVKGVCKCLRPSAMVPVAVPTPPAEFTGQSGGHYLKFSAHIRGNMHELGAILYWKFTETT